MRYAGGRASRTVAHRRCLRGSRRSVRACAQAVMGDADYHPNPCVIICPFATCRKAHYHLNGFSTVSQLYSHWQKKHTLPALERGTAVWLLRKS